MRNNTLLIAALTSVVSTAALATPPSAPPSASPSKAAAPRPKAATAPAAPFMGSIDIKVTAPRDSGGVARFHMSDAGIATEVDLGSSPDAPPGMRFQTRTLTKTNSPAFFVIDDKSKSYREIALGAMRAASQQRAGSETWTVEKVGTEKVAGFPAQHVVATSSNGVKMDVWTTTAIGSDEAFHKAFVDQAKLSPQLMEALDRNGAGGIPAKVFAKTPQGDMGIEIVAVKMGAPAKNLFELPADYKKLEEAVMPRGAMRQKPAKNIEGKLTL